MFYLFSQPTESILRDHYEEHKGKPFFEGLIRFMQSGPVIPMVRETFMHFIHS